MANINSYDWSAFKFFAANDKSVENLLAERFGQLKEDLTQRLSKGISSMITGDSILGTELLDSISVPRCVFRVDSFRSILDTFLETFSENLENPELSTDLYRQTLREAGERVGLTFANDLLRLLIQLKHIPLTPDALVMAWTAFDRAGQWGQFELDSIGDNILERLRLPGSERVTVNMRIRHNFLRYGSSDTSHPHCSFLEGYVHYILDELFLEWGRLKFTSFLPRIEVLHVDEVKKPATKEGNGDTFSVTLHSEMFPVAREKCAKGVLSIDESRKDALTNFREALIQAILTKIGVTKPEGERDRMVEKALFRQFRDVPGFPVKQCQDLYSNLSREVHDEARVVAMNEYIKLRRLIQSIQGIHITKDQLEKIRQAKNEFFQSRTK